MEPDVALLMDIRTGDKKALALLVEKYKKTAYRMALGLVGNRDDALDISQEVFLRIYNSAKTFDTSQPFLPWFYKIISNLCRTWLRKRSARDNKMVAYDQAAFLVADETNPEKSLLAKEQVSRLQEALLKLSFEEREIITLQHFRGMTYEEIAELLGIPKGTVMSRLYYARKKLAKLMRQNDG
jgi:RNA polymerase sigma-70 factor (ECF subfamily)